MSVNSIISQADGLLQSPEAQQLIVQQFQELAGARSSVPAIEVEKAAPNAVWAVKQHISKQGVQVREVKQKEIRGLLKAFTTKADHELDAAEFEEFMCSLVKYGAVKGRKGSGKRWALRLVLAGAGAVAVVAGLPLAVPALAGSTLAGTGLLAAGPVGAAVAAASLVAGNKRTNAEARKVLFPGPVAGPTTEPAADGLAAERAGSTDEVDVAALVATAPALEAASAAAGGSAGSKEGQAEEAVQVAAEEGVPKVVVAQEQQQQQQQKAPQLQVPEQQEEEQQQAQPSPFAPATPKGSPAAVQSSASESSSGLLHADAAAQLQRTGAASAADSELPPLRTATTPPLTPDADAMSEISESGRRSSKDGRVTKWIQRTLSASSKDKLKRFSDDASNRSSVDKANRSSIEKSDGSMTDGTAKAKGTDKMKDWLRRSVSLTSRSSADGGESKGMLSKFRAS